MMSNMEVEIHVPPAAETRQISLDHSRWAEASSGMCEPVIADVDELEMRIIRYHSQNQALLL